jgi:chromosome partitioning protein
MTCRTIAVVNAGGGTGKTTLAYALILAAASRGERVVALDLDPCASLTSVLSPSGKAGTTAYDVLIENVPIISALTDVKLVGVPDSIRILGSDARLLTQIVSVEALRAALDTLGENADLVVVDTPSQISALGGILGAADHIVIPTPLDYIAVLQSTHTIALAQQLAATERVRGLVVTFARRRMSLAHAAVFRGLVSAQVSMNTIPYTWAAWHRCARKGIALPPAALAEATALLAEALSGRTAPAAALDALALSAGHRPEERAPARAAAPIGPRSAPGRYSPDPVAHPG